MTAGNFRNRFTVIMAAEGNNNRTGEAGKVTGKDKCKILKEIRAQIARENDIDLVIEECTHKGKCRGTCPRCESEVAYLERELEKRRQTKKRVALAGVSVGVTLALSGCAAIEAVEDAVWALQHGGDDPGVIEVVGIVPCYDPNEPEAIDGEIAPEELEGDVAMLPEDADGE